MPIIPERYAADEKIKRLVEGREDALTNYRHRLYDLQLHFQGELHNIDLAINARLCELIKKEKAADETNPA